MPGKVFSIGEEEFALHCKIYNQSPVREFVFASPRKYRFDFAWPDLMIAAEIEGGTWNGGRHTRGSGFAADCAKYNLAALMGWKVFRFTGDMVTSGNAIDTILSAIGAGADSTHVGSSASPPVPRAPARASRSKRS